MFIFFTNIYVGVFLQENKLFTNPSISLFGYSPGVPLPAGTVLLLLANPKMELKRDCLALILDLNPAALYAAHSALIPGAKVRKSQGENLKYILTKATSQKFLRDQRFGSRVMQGLSEKHPLLK